MAKTAASALSDLGLDAQLDEVVAELRGLRRGHTKDGAPIGADDAVWQALTILLRQAFTARAEVAGLHRLFELNSRNHDELAGVVASVAAAARDVADRVADGSAGAAVLKVSYVPSRTGETTLPPAVVVPKGAAQ